MPAVVTGPVENVKRSSVASQLSIKKAFRNELFLYNVIYLWILTGKLN